MYRAVALSVLVGVLGGCGLIEYRKIDHSTIGSYSTSGLCEFLDANRWSTTFDERETIYRELERRRQRCN